VGERLDGRLILVGTPIGNLGDLSPRACEVLAAADVICCEDTRHTRKLLTHAGITPRRLLAVHDHNEAAAAPSLVALAADGATVAVVTDAGLPGISDPGERLVRAAIEAGIRVEVVPGPSAAVAALVVSGLPAGHFCFEGFLPRKGGERTARLAEIAVEPRTVVMFESPHRVGQTVDNLVSVCGGQRPVAIVRELTKLHEEVWRGTLAAAAAHLSEGQPRGEYVLVLGGAPPAATDAGPVEIEARLAQRIAAGEDRKTAVAAVAVDLRVPKRAVYDVSIRAHRRGDPEAAQ
jgi:16S rRNA (cytidine1402-2'-O)-methyltransferase